MVGHQWKEHPALGGSLVERVVVYRLTGDGEILPPWQGELTLVIPHPCLVPPLHKVGVWLVDVDLSVPQGPDMARYS